eukprot:gnl/TRDRNA2_/TRDRNA2_82737_c0_seq2.p1 gnl/TRDRNA2_/TRDRNA2_82737_c0~~gnl/TRDRNA2_/TRDRNA2_82737_c0_seq2.p1  ORF type:complete len:807 (-),score=128.44 gnl/TRDRNA2_/TRDRNA2_82737_c0_seq2:72-2423(-)
MGEVAWAPPMQHDVLNHFRMTEQEQRSGKSRLSQAFDIKNRCAPAIGAVLAGMLVLVFIISLPYLRPIRSHLWRKFSGTRCDACLWIFSKPWPVIYVLLLLWGERFWIFMLLPAFLIFVDRLLVLQRPRPYAVVERVQLLLFDVMHLTVQKPPEFSYQAGQWVYLGWKGEWHPFTLTSAPEERVLTLHIRIPDNKGWCAALRRRLVSEAPAGELEDAEGQPVPKGAKPEPGTVVDYYRCVDPVNKVVYGRPCNGMSRKASSGPSSDLGSSKADSEVDPELHPPSESSESLSGASSKLPADAVVLRLSGPFGTRSQLFWEFETVMVVGSGMGVTPLVSILRSVQIRCQHRQAILSTAGIGVGTMDYIGENGLACRSRATYEMRKRARPWALSSGAASPDPSRASPPTRRPSEEGLPADSAYSPGPWASALGLLQQVAGQQHSTLGSAAEVTGLLGSDEEMPVRDEDPAGAGRRRRKKEGSKSHKKRQKDEEAILQAEQESPPPRLSRSKSASHADLQAGAMRQQARTQPAVPSVAPVLVGAAATDEGPRIASDSEVPRPSKRSLREDGVFGMAPPASPGLQRQYSSPPSAQSTYGFTPSQLTGTRLSTGSSTSPARTPGGFPTTLVAPPSGQVPAAAGGAAQSPPSQWDLKLIDLVQDIVAVPNRIHFFWVIRSQEEFDWLFDILAAALEGPARDIIDICIFSHGDVELSQIRGLPCSHRQFVGRPNWSMVFKQQKEMHPRDHIGVFLCGDPALGADLSKQSAKYSDPPDRAGGTRFSFFEEHF